MSSPAAYRDITIPTAYCVVSLEGLISVLHRDRDRDRYRYRDPAQCPVKTPLNTRNIGASGNAPRGRLSPLAYNFIEPPRLPLIIPKPSTTRPLHAIPREFPPAFEYGNDKKDHGTHLQPKSPPAIWEKSRGERTLVRTCRYSRYRSRECNCSGTIVVLRRLFYRPVYNRCTAV